jgi:DNA-binding GntR family transcriptional regulator
MNGDRSIPYYFQVAQTIRRRIAEGTYKHGTLLPPARELEKDFGVSDITIRRALQLLVEDRAVVRTRGIGTLIIDPKVEQKFDAFGNFLEAVGEEEGKSSHVEVEVLEIAETCLCPEAVLQTLSLGPNEKVWRMKRVRRIHGKPISYFINYGKTGLFDAINKRLASKSSFVKLAGDKCGIHFWKMEQWVESIVADKDLAALLETNFGIPLLFATNVYFLSSAEPVAVSQMYFRGDRYKYHTEKELS